MVNEGKRLGLTVAMGLNLLCISAMVLWCRRRHVAVLGVPVPTEKPRWAIPPTAAVLALALCLPEIGYFLLYMVFLELMVLARIAPVRDGMGLADA